MDIQPILSLNAFDPAAAHDLNPAIATHVHRRSQVFGAASVLFYDEPLEFVRAEGCFLYASDGAAYLDAYNNVPAVGHCHPAVAEAVARQLRTLNVHSRYLHPGITAYAESLLATLPPGLSNVTFTCTGSESNDLALRLAAHATGAGGVIVTQAAYHGNTGLVSQVSPSLFLPAAPAKHVRLVPAPDSSRDPPEALARRFADHVTAAIADLERCGVGFSALLVDCIFSSDGVHPHPRGFLRPAVEAVHRARGFLIADEVQCGFGRTGESLWGFERHGVQPDVVTLGKPMGNGYPIGAVITRPEILESFISTMGYFNTFGGSPVAAAAGQAVLDVIEREGLMENALEVGEHLLRGLADLSSQHELIGAVRGAGLYIGVEIAGGAPAAGAAGGAAQAAKVLINGLRDRRVLIGSAGRYGSVLKIRPPLCFSPTNADQLLGALDDVLTHLSRSR